MADKYKKVKDMSIVVTLSLREVFDAYFTPSSTKPERETQDSSTNAEKETQDFGTNTEKKTQGSSTLFSDENLKCLKIILSRLGYLFTEEEFHRSLQNIAKDRLIRSKAGNSTTEGQSESVLKFDFKSFIVF